MTHEEMEEVKRHFGVVADGLRSDIRLVAEGHRALDGKMDGVRQDLQELRGDVRSDIRLLAEGQVGLRQEFGGMRQEFQEFREEMRDFRQQVAGEFKEVRALIKFSYAELDERLKSVERDVLLLKTRLDQIDGKQT